jgi:para-aminobenzoate synthetase component II
MQLNAQGQMQSNAQGKMKPRILVIDNYDSFVYNIIQYLTELGADVKIVRNDAIAPTEILKFDGVVISPGPGNPKGAGISLEVVAIAAQNKLPLLGVCLGHQAIGEYFGCTISAAPEVLHGKLSKISHDNNLKGVLRDLPNNFNATRYHSLAISEDTLSPELLVIGRSETGTIMAITHKNLPIDGVQFHPESIMTEHGHQIFKNWLDSFANLS